MYSKILKIYPLFFIIFFLTFFPKYIFADTQDSSAIDLIQTVGLSINSLPLNDFYSPSSVSYDEESIFGMYSSEISNVYNIENLVDMDGKRRIPGELDSLRLPPRSLVDLTYFYQNISDVFLEKISTPLSLNNFSSGSLANVINVTGWNLDRITTKWGEVSLYKDGVSKEYKVDRNLTANGQGNLLLGTYQVIQPLEITSWSVVPNFDSQVVGITVVVKNISDEYLNDIGYEHCGYLLKRNFLPFEEFIYKYELDKNFKEDEDIDLSTIQIDDPNTRVECSVSGSRWYQYFLTDSISVFSYFNNSWFSGAYVQPQVESFCIQRLPYKFNSPSIKYIYKQVSVDNIVENKDNQEVLGIEYSAIDKLKELPKTFKNDPFLLLCLLVVDIYLWYSFCIKRRQYESKNNNTRICSKSCKDAQ